MRRRDAGILLLLLLGAAVTSFWLARGGQTALLRVGPAWLAALFAMVCALTTANLLLRWARWHFLLRSLGLRLKARESLAVWFGTLPAILTPLYLGELLRAFALAPRFPRARAAVVWIWLVERVADAAVLALLWLLAAGRAVGASLLLALLLALVFGARRITLRAAGIARPHTSGARYAAFVLGTSLVSWSLPILALLGVTAGLGQGAGAPLSARAWAEGTLLGGISLVPGGTGVTGSTAILVLVDGGVPEAVATASLAVVRAGTLWYAVALGFLVLWRFRAQIRSLVRAEPGHSHFDAIAEGYPEQLPAHTRDRFVERKVELMIRRLEEAGISRGARGLDIGCGQGWHAARLAEAGFSVLGIDLSARQLAQARAQTRGSPAPLAWVAADAAVLPVADASVDFAYAVNSVHHVHDPRGRDHLLREVVRVLRPGGVFCLHEMNTRNPLFSFYLAYVYPLIKEIDEGDEMWIRFDALPPLAGAGWDPRIETFTFLPDVLPRGIEQALLPVERWLETSRLRSYSAHYLAVLRKCSRV